MRMSRILGALVAAVFLFVNVACAGQGLAGGSIRGEVTDAANNPVAGAKVRLEGDHSVNHPIAARDATSGPDGTFQFEGLDSGIYALTAQKNSRVSPRAQVEIKVGDSLLVKLVVGLAGTAGSTASEQTMQFSDSPNFTVAGVTDWTAAGGHGSDVSLRTSEALNQQTLALKPNEAEKSTNSAEAAELEARLRKALVAAPLSFDTNRQLGQLYLRERRYGEAVAPLQKAYDAHPADTANESDLAQTLKESGDLVQARRHIEHVLAHADTGDAHRVRGAIDEASGDPLRAVQEFALAVQRDPSEQNYFAWGEELLQHRAVLQAKEVFERGVRLYPKSSRLLTSLGAALFGAALYEQSAERLCEASDLDPHDPEPYEFMGKIEVVAPHFASCMDGHLARYAELFPKDALASYFYAMDLWRQQGSAIDAASHRRVEELLTRAVSLDPKCSDAYLQLGNLKSSEKDFPAAVDRYTKAIAIDPQSSEAHYRLGTVYDRLGEREKAKAEFAAHEAINEQQAAETERQRKEIKQFVVEADRTRPTQ